MTRRILPLCAAFAFGVVSAVALPVFAFGPGPDGDQSANREAHHQGKMERMAETLGLSDAQVTDLKALKTASKSGRDSLRELHHGLKSDMDAAGYPGNWSGAQVAEFRARSMDMAGEKAGMRFEGMVDMAGVLTPEQFVKFKEMKAEKKSRHGGHHGKKGGEDGFRGRLGGEL